ncbi:hypothetical protein D9758_004701 [Tetrapyrgos nigripes]|uniref:Uncharacterized protein n=1 Tax=Tetrapyrgos nigripes TaxID=182062 RepID=A0A8H5LYJ7_9AGAR|nr:hypothetical protein D9758_004701 [Tetrapyrgos nigripes]
MNARDIPDDSYSLYLDLSDKMKSAWLAQATWTFDELGVDTSRYDDFHFTDRICYRFSWESDTFDNHKDTFFLPQQKIFLFLPPFKQIQEGQRLLFPTTLQPPYWSFDSSGSTQISLKTGKLLGLPEFEIETVIRHCAFQPPLSWAVFDYQRNCGHDPSTKTYSLEHGMPTFEFIWNKSRFEVEDIPSNSDSGESSDSDSMHDGITPITSASLEFHTTDCADREVAKAAMAYMNTLGWRLDVQEADEARKTLILAASDSESNSGSESEGIISLSHPNWDRDSICHLAECYDVRRAARRCDYKELSMQVQVNGKWMWDLDSQGINKGRRHSLPSSWAPDCSEYS